MLSKYCFKIPPYAFSKKVIQVWAPHWLKTLVCQLSFPAEYRKLGGFYVYLAHYNKKYQILIKVDSNMYSRRLNSYFHEENEMTLPP